MPLLTANRKTTGTRVASHTLFAVNEFNELFPGLPASMPTGTPPWKNPGVRRMSAWSSSAPHLAPEAYAIERLN